MARVDESDSFLLCRIGSRIGALALKDVRETMRALPIAPLNESPLFVLGLAIIRGSPTPVIDARQLLGCSAPFTSITAPSSSRFVSLKLGERTAALAVDAVLDVCSLEAGALMDVPSLLGSAATEYVSVIGALDTELLLVLKAARLVPDSVWNSHPLSGAST